MKRKIVLAAAVLAVLVLSAAGCEEKKMKEYEPFLSTGNVGAVGHVQGIVADAAGDYIYSSITDVIVRQAADGTVVGTVTGFGGEDGERHVGDIAFNPDDGKLYVSMIADVQYGSAAADNSREKNCYVVIIDPEAITGMNMQAEDVCSVVYVGAPVVALASAQAGDWDLRLGGKYGVKNGVDACTFGPAFGTDGGKQYLTMVLATAAHSQEADGKTAYDRQDVDYFTILQFDVAGWDRYAKPFGQLDEATGPETADATYFYYAGFHDYGAQNLCYDRYKNVYFITTYATDYATPSRSRFPNYMFFVVDAAFVEEKPLIGNGAETGLVLRSACGIAHESGVSGFGLSAGVGVLSLGDGRYYVAGVAKGGAELTLYRWSDDMTECCIVPAL